ncbi:hypothetical protein [Noviherbaspirillum aerium]|uniref:hypothetical protein n=1 Tax=Noviherbaspirillum aerium TaxID=2588497 RepID=UPI00124F443A|nr:hypothetical protein [Noviherbaspirillum aerium]
MRIQKEVVLSIVLGIAFVSAGLWLIERSMSTSMRASQKGPVESKDVTDQQAASPRIPPQTAGNAEIRPPVAHGIRKCIVSGKTVYSDTECPAGAKIEDVVLHDSGGIMSPPKADLLVLMAQRKAAEAQNAGQQNVLTVGAPRSASEECILLDQHIQYLDAKARQPQSAVTQNWIRQERSKTRDRQVALNC